MVQSYLPTFRTQGMLTLSLSPFLRTFLPLSPSSLSPSLSLLPSYLPPSLPFLSLFIPLSLSLLSVCLSVPLPLSIYISIFLFLCPYILYFLSLCLFISVCGYGLSFSFPSPLFPSLPIVFISLSRSVIINTGRRKKNLKIVISIYNGIFTNSFRPMY